MKPYLSVIIPYYNNRAGLDELLRSLQASKKAPSFEVIVVDDGSIAPLSFQPPSWNPVVKKGGSRVKSGMTRIKTIRLSRNKGPAIARNRGVEKARGEFVVFLDGDVCVFSDTLYQIAKVYRDDPDVVALTGVWAKEQKSKDFFPNFKALRDWSYWINERDKSGYYFLFSTRIASIKRAVFERLGGFDETYPAPLVEDIELTYRIARRYAIIFAPQVRVRHEFENFWPIAKKYFLRAYYWTKLYAARKRFDPVATTLQEALTSISGAGVVVGLGVSLVALLGGYVHFSYMFLAVAAVVTVFHLFFVRKFLFFVYQERGGEFAFKSFFVGLVLYTFIVSGAVAGRVYTAR